MHRAPEGFRKGPEHSLEGKDGNNQMQQCDRRNNSVAKMMKIFGEVQEGVRKCMNLPCSSPFFLLSSEVMST